MKLQGGEDDNDQDNQKHSRKLRYVLRKHQRVLRLHKHKADEDYFAYIYGQLVLFWPWRDEKKDLHWDNYDACEGLFNESHVQEMIQKNRAALFPLQAQIEKLNFDKSEKPCHLGDQLDAQNIQENEDDLEEELQDEDFYLWDEELEGQDAAIDHSNPKNRVNLDYETIVPSMRPKTKEELCHAIRTHSVDQHHIFKIFFTYALDVAKCKLAQRPPPDPPLILMHGGGGKTR